MNKTRNDRAGDEWHQRKAVLEKVFAVFNQLEDEYNDLSR